MDINRAAIFIPDEPIRYGAVTLSKPISAIQLIRKEDGGAKLGLLTQLGQGTQVVHCGDGFNDRTVKVRAHESFYFVFVHDLQDDQLAAVAY